MNLISEDCHGGFVYEELKEQFTNPFIWCYITKDDMYYLIKHYNEINFNDYEISKSFVRNRPKNKMDIFKIRVNNKIDIHYTHYHFKEDAKVRIVKKPDVYWNKIWEYVVEKYEIRLKRMTENPVFLINFSRQEYNKLIREKYLKEEFNYKLIIITENEEELKYANEKKMIILDKTEHLSMDGLPDKYVKRNIDKIKEFINADN